MNIDSQYFQYKIKFGTIYIIIPYISHSQEYNLKNTVYIDFQKFCNYPNSKCINLNFLVMYNLIYIPYKYLLFKINNFKFFIVTKVKKYMYYRLNKNLINIIHRLFHSD